MTPYSYKKRGAILLALMVGFLVISIKSTSLSAAVLINGVGATFPYPLYSRWFFEYHKAHPEVEINYQSIGSGGGIRQLSERTVDFGASDIPMSDHQLAKSPFKVLHIPTVLGAVVFVYHLPNLIASPSKAKSNAPVPPIQLQARTVADIFLGHITRWNDPRITALNSQLILPNEPIVVVRRSDGSGTTAVVTDYLAKVSTEWREKVGSGASVNWPVGLGGKGNDGVAGLLRQTSGAIGYTELVFAKNANLSYATLQNPSGAYVAANFQSVSAAADEAIKQMPEDFRMYITQMAGLQSYPIVAFTYLLIHKIMPKEKGKELTTFMTWALKEGQLEAEKLFYTPLPPKLIKRVESKLHEIQLH